MISDLVAAVVESAIPGPQTDRGVLLLLTGLGAVLVLAQFWIRTVPEAGLLALVNGVAGVLLGLVSLRRSAHVALSLVCVSMNAMAIASPFLF